MKKFITTSILLAMFATCTTITAQNQQEEYLGLPGDNLNLYAVMKLFQESETLEGFERNLNDENSRINNLDLNGDNYVDYIKVLDYIDGDVHTIVMQVAIDKRENQDVAVFTVQRFNSGQVQIQLVGDEALYGRNYIIEPILDVASYGETPNPGYTLYNGQNVNIVRTTRYEVANWPVVRFIYLPTYTIWRSSWYWGYYPSYWHPWRQNYWHYYYGYHYNWYNHYYGHYCRIDYHRYPRWNNFYYSSRRAHSPYVSTRIQAGRYKATYSRPEQRRKGEALYTKMYASQNGRRTDNSSVNNTAKRSGNASTTDRQYNSNATNTSRRTSTTTTNRSVAKAPSGQNNSTARRVTTTATNRPVAKAPSGQNNSTARRSTTTATNRPVAKAPSGQNNSTARRSTTTVTNRPVAKAPSVQKASTARRSTTTVTNRPVAKAPSRQKASTARSSVKSTTTRVSSSSSRSSGSSRPATTQKKAGNQKQSQTSKPTRR